MKTEPKIIETEEVSIYIEGCNALLDVQAWSISEVRRYYRHAHHRGALVPAGEWLSKAFLESIKMSPALRIYLA
jgi:hypothetical protein